MLCCEGQTIAQHAYTWDELKEKLRANNASLLAGRLEVEESRAMEITAYLRPNPDLTVTLDQINPFTNNPSNNGGPGGYRPFGEALPFVSANYLIERKHKRQLRLQSAQEATAVAASQLADQERNLLFNLRQALVQSLQQKAVLEVVKENLAYYDRVLGVSRDRLSGGDIAQIDLDRLELQRVQYESDVQMAEVNLRTAKIQLLQLLNDRTPVSKFDVAGNFDFAEQLQPLEEFRMVALASRPDLKAAVQSIEKARTDYKLATANGSADPTIGTDFGRNPPIPVYLGVSVSIPLRLFDRNQGEKLRTQLEIRRSEKLRDANISAIYGDVDSAYATVNSNLTLLRPYKQQYLPRALRVRETITFSYQHGGASLLDFLSAENEYRSIRLSFVNLVGSYLSAANQLNFAVGREVLQ